MTQLYYDNILNQRNQPIISANLWDAFGEQLKKLGGSAGSPTGEAKYTYGGKELNDETNLYYFRCPWMDKRRARQDAESEVNARFYDATIGRFINVDPIQDGTNCYIYCNNNPLSFVDPTGLEEVKMTDKELANYQDRQKEAKTAQDDKSDSWKTPAGTDWEYGFFGGDQYSGGVHGNDKMSEKTFQKDSLNSVDEAFKQHDLESFNKGWPDLNSKEALQSHYKLVDSLDKIIKSGEIRDTVTGKLLPSVMNCKRIHKYIFL